MRLVRIALIPGLLLMAVGSFSAQYFWASHVESAEMAYWNNELDLAKGGRMRIGRFVEETLGHVCDKSDWRMVNDKLVVKAQVRPQTVLSYSEIVVHVEVDCQARIIGGRAEVESHSF